MTQLAKWFGYTRDEYYEQVWQPGDPQWEELTPDEDGSNILDNKVIDKYPNGAIL